MAGKDFLVELGTEELPPTSLPRFLEHLQEGFEKELSNARFSFKQVKSFATPRRLAVLVSGLSSHQADHQVEKKGPAVKAAFDADGNPTRAAQGFAQSCGVSVEELEQQDTPKGAWLMFRSMEKGLPAAEVLPDLSEKVFATLPVARRMRWGAGQEEFVRPVHWLLMLLGSKVIDAEILGKKASNKTRGHRFLSTGAKAGKTGETGKTGKSNSALTIKNPGEYVESLRKASVLVDFDERREAISEQLQAAAKNASSLAGTEQVIDAELLDEVTGLVEWPVVLTGQFDADFLQVPDETLISAMSKHQRYFHMLDKKGDLMPFFHTVANIKSTKPAAVIQGNERVLKARLSDARFFYQQDCKVSLEQRLPGLENVTFQAELGSYKDKSERIANLARQMATEVQADPENTYRAGLLCKTDLLTDMVGEFPDLQGLMGSYYARHDKEKEIVSAAIGEHYKPAFAGDSIPETLIGKLVSLADRLDTLVGLFGIGQPPSGSRDPFALRRAALGVIRILLEGKLNLNLDKLLSESLRHYQPSLKVGSKELEASVSSTFQLFEYLLDRAEYWYQEQSIPLDVFRAVRQSKDPMFDLLATDKKIRALNKFRSTSEAPALVEVNKRVSNILKDLDIASLTEPDSSLFKEDAEKNLHQAIKVADNRVEQLTAGADFDAVFSELASLQSVIDTYFLDVMVMCDDEAVKNNRLATLASLRRLFLRVADLSVMQF